MAGGGEKRFSELMSRALSESLPRMRRRADTAALISEKEYHRLSGSRPDFWAFPTHGESFEGLGLAYDQSPMRNSSVLPELQRPAPSLPLVEIPSQ